jgi:hypothetical protein
MKLIFPAGTTSKKIRIYIQDSTKVDGSGLTGLVYNTSGLTWYWIEDGDSSSTSVSIVTATLGTYTSGGFKEVDGTNMPGIYEIGLPTGVLAGGTANTMLKGVTNMAPVLIEIQTEAIPISSNIKKNQALNNFQFLMTDSTTHLVATGKTVSVTRSIDGAAFGAGSLSSVTELSNGVYGVNFSAGDLNGNCIVLRATATGCDDAIERILTQPI